MNWYIAKHPAFGSITNTKNFQTNITPIKITEGLSYFLEGYFVPRISENEKYRKLDFTELLGELFKKYKMNFINHIKGVFNLVLFVNDEFYIFNDRHSLKKFFIYQDGQYFIISNNIKLISEKIKLEFSKENAIIFYLFEHFINGKTLFDKVEYSKPASLIKYSKRLAISNYWNPESLIKQKIRKYSFDYLANQWKSIIGGYIDFLSPKDITMTLTGGNDSRMLLTGLLANKIKPNAFTFGNPESSDGVIAKQIADYVGLNYHNYFVTEPTKEWFEKYALKIIEMGNTLINIHRAHRLDAIENEIQNNPDNEMILCGFMGGDYIKGIIYDDYITAKFMRLWKYSAISEVDKIKEILTYHLIDYKEFDLEYILNQIKTFPYLNNINDDIIREFYFLFYVLGAVHVYQDSHIFSSKIKFLVNPFMDVDFLELLFSSPYSMLHKNNSEDNFHRKLKYPEFAVNINYLLAPELSQIPYAKKGFYSDEEYLSNKIVYILKRLWRYRSKYKYPQNFPYGIWMKEFVETQLIDLHPYVKEIIKSGLLIEKLEKDRHLTTEGYWHRFTNPINISMNLKYLGL
ncbi:hypothetical protein Calab_0559 [Caldithrix abyssi DSM 13497]|uniref:asparagine synthase (glutamine-hydrolyzing) n=1 Tax=Caldithrix abyssi DSM 13497 TaxID=880073 RepID=H1XS38_CALAY|nr:hypothetical protein [Caldithrix abyssi]APF20141.1 Glutamine amidotransferase class-II:Asparagine synthase [Caldithrix abyssi DSM 13497]EHO40202.1 hypothetical protein Calab_0559 [Caldithrix abyssi DSM 13497]